MGSSFVSHSPALFAMESANSESEVSESDRPVKGARGWSASPRRARQPSSRKKPRRERQPSSPKRTWREREPCSRQTPRHEGEPCWRQTQGGPPPQKDCSLGVYVLDVNHVQSDEQMTQAAKVAPAKIMVLTKAPRCFTHRLKSETTRDERHERTKWVVKRGNSDPHDDCVCVAVRYDERSHRAASSTDPLPAPPEVRPIEWRAEDAAAYGRVRGGATMQFFVTEIVWPRGTAPRADLERLCVAAVDTSTCDKEDLSHRFCQGLATRLHVRRYWGGWLVRQPIHQDPQQRR